MDAFHCCTKTKNQQREKKHYKSDSINAQNASKEKLSNYTSRIIGWPSGVIQTKDMRSTEIYYACTTLSF
jgi:hypothetical protein